MARSLYVANHSERIHFPCQRVRYGHMITTILSKAGKYAVFFFHCLYLEYSDVIDTDESSYMLRTNVIQLLTICQTYPEFPGSGLINVKLVPGPKFNIYPGSWLAKEKKKQNISIWQLQELAGRDFRKLLGCPTRVFHDVTLHLVLSCVSFCQ